VTVRPAPPFGTLLRTLREAAGLTQEALAERARISVRGIQYLERGASRTPRRGTVDLLASALALAPPERTRLTEVAGAPSSILPARPPDPGTRPADAGTDLDHPGLPTLPTNGALTPLVGREQALTLLDRFPAGGRDAPEPVLLLAGEPGIGKTRLLQEVAQRAVAGGWRVLAGGCYRRGGQEPYAPLLDALAQYLHAQRPEQLRTALKGCAWLARLLPELAVDPALDVSLAGAPLAGALQPGQERRLMFAAVARFLANVAGPAGTLLVLDDLQWAGPDALDLLAALVRSPSPAHKERGVVPLAGGVGEGLLRIVGAYRDTEVGPADPLGLLLADLARARLVAHQALGPLAPGEAAALLDDLLAGAAGGDRAVAARVLERAGGAPFFLVSYAQALRTGGSEAAGAPPWDLAQGVRQRVALLPGESREILGAAAVVGRSAPRALLLTVTGQPEEAVLSALEAACRARLLLEDGDDAYVFAHDVIREVVEADLSAARRAALHRRVATALERAVGVAPEVVAHHYMRGGAVEQALPYLERAGDHAWSQRASGAADAHYVALLERLDFRGQALDAARVREKRGAMFHEMGRFGAAIEALEPATKTYEAADDRESLARVTARIGRLYSDHGLSRTGIARLTPLVERMERTGAPPAILVALHEALAVVLITAGEYAEALAEVGRAAELARAGDATHTLARAAFNHAGLLQLLGRLGESLGVAREAVALADRASDPLLLRATLRDMAMTHALRGSLAAARSSIDRAIRVGEREPTLPMLFVLCLRGWIAFLSGDWPGAQEEIDQALALSREADHSFWSSYVPIFQARLSLARGAWADTAASIGEAIALAERNDDLQARRWASAVMAELDILEGRADAAAARLIPLLDRPGLEECDVTTLLPALAWARLEQGRIDRARARPARGDAAGAGGGAARAGPRRAAPGGRRRGRARPGGGRSAGARYLLSLRRGAATARRRTSPRRGREAGAGAGAAGGGAGHLPPPGRAAGRRAG